MLESADVKHADGSIRATGGELVPAGSWTGTPLNIVDGFVMGNQLS